MASISISLGGDADIKLGALQAAIHDVGASEAGAAAVRLKIQRHFLDLPPNERGFPSSNFWQRAAASVTDDIDGDDVVISVTQVGVHRRFFGTGGPITPGQYGSSEARYFAVPNQPETYGILARDFPKEQMRFAFAQDENGDFHAALVARENTPIQKRGQHHSHTPAVNTVMYWLYRTINQAPNPDVLPTNEEMYQAFGDGVLNFIRAKLHAPGLTYTVEGAQ